MFAAVSDDARQCGALWDDLQCQLVVGHNSAHAALVASALMSWVNPDADDPASMALEWAGQMDDI
jgi:hypothetical protein